MKPRIEGLFTFIGIITSQFVLQELGYVKNVPNSMIAGALCGALFGIIGYFVSSLINRFSRKGKSNVDTRDNKIEHELSKDIPVATTPLYIGFGGWLIIFSLGLIYQFFTNLKNFYDNYLLVQSDEFSELTTIGKESYNSLWYPGIVYEMIIQSFSVVSILLITFFMIRMSRKFKYVTIVYISSLIPLIAIEVFLMLSIQNGYSEEIFTSDDLYKPLYRSFIYAIVWIPYMLKSKRVKNTFTTN